MDIERIVNQHKFCFKCAGKLEYKEHNLLICGGCGYHNFINPVPCSGAILENENVEILLVERKVDPMKGYLDMAGGFIDLGENAEDGMTRELKEELGIDIFDVKYFGSYIDMYEYDGIILPTLGLIFTAKLTGQKISVHDDISGFKFFKKNQIPFEDIAFDGLKKALKQYISTK